MKIKGFVFVFLSFVLIQGCAKKSVSDFNSDFSLFKEFISNFSGGIVSTKSDIRVVLGFNKTEWKANQVLDSDLFDISPSVDGKVIALSGNTIAFVPKEKLKQNTAYQITLHLSKLIKTPEKLEDFNFTVKTIKQDFIVVTNDIQSYSKDSQYLNCVLKTADVVDLESVIKLVSAQQNGNNLAVKFDKSIPSGTEFSFVIDKIQRLSTESKVEIDFDESALEADNKDKIEYIVAAKNDFKVIKVDVPEGNNQTLSINFSEPLLKGQDFRGLVSIQNARNLKFSVQGNLLKVFFNNIVEAESKIVNEVSTTVDSASVTPVVEYVATKGEEPQLLTGELLVEIFRGIESAYGQKMDKDYTTKISFDQIKPGVRFVKNGTILPSSNNLKLNFEAANLSAVDVKVYKIYKNNILQFLQDNLI
ncbi:MAG TPA: hypothetical protein VJ780_05675, partial [Flavobacterium sp.]|nr:hypothetical protein [Flavobacterium sp.]